MKRKLSLKKDLKNDSKDTKKKLKTGSVSDQKTPSEFATIWKDVDDTFKPRKTIPSEWVCDISPEIDCNSTPFEIFSKLVPKSLQMYIVQCTNERLEMFEEEDSNRGVIEKTSVG